MTPGQRRWDYTLDHCTLHQVILVSGLSRPWTDNTTNSGVGSTGEWPVQPRKYVTATHLLPRTRRPGRRTCMNATLPRKGRHEWIQTDRKSSGRRPRRDNVAGSSWPLLGTALKVPLPKGPGWVEWGPLTPDGRGRSDDVVRRRGHACPSLPVHHPTGARSPLCPLPERDRKDRSNYK